MWEPFDCEGESVSVVRIPGSFLVDEGPRTDPEIAIAPLEFMGYPMPEPPWPQMGGGVWPLTRTQQIMRAILAGIAAGQWGIQGFIPGGQTADWIKQWDPHHELRQIVTEACA